MTKGKKTEITFLDWLKLVVSFRYISNISIIVAIFSYWLNAYELFFICIPLIVVNFIIFVLMSIFDFNEYINGVLGTIISDKQVINNYKNEFIILNIIWHVLPLFWIYSILSKDNLINLFKPNFINIFFKSSIIAIIYFYYERNLYIYGKIDYLKYFIIYILVLFGINVFLYLE